jgi:TrkA domain protein
MPQIDETPLPGVGIRQDFGCRSGTRIGVITRTSGRRELLVYDASDPDAVRTSLELTAEESEALADLLGRGAPAQQVEHLSAGVIPGLAIDWVRVPLDQRPRSIAEMEVRTRTGASVVAIVRAGDPIPAPGPEAVIEPGDTVVLVGTPSGIEAATRLLETGRDTPSA